MQSDINGKQTKPVRINITPEFVYRIDLCFVASNRCEFGSHTSAMDTAIHNTKQGEFRLKFTLLLEQNQLKYICCLMYLNFE